MLSRCAAFNTWGVFAIAYATTTLKLHKVPVLISVTTAALLMAVPLPVSGLLTDRLGAKKVYATGIAAYAVAVFAVFAIFGTGNIWLYALAMLVVFGVIHALFYGAQGTLYASAVPRPDPLHRTIDRLPVVGCVHRALRR
jgi:MFS family permease